MTGLAFSSDHSYLASLSLFGELNIWNPSANWSLKNSLNNVSPCYTLIQLSNNQLAVGSGYNINIWSPLTKVDGPIRTLTGHSSTVSSLALSPDNSILASGSYDGQVMLWNYTNESTSYKTLADQESYPRVRITVCFVSNQILASGSIDGTIKIWNITLGKQNLLTF